VTVQLKKINVAVLFVADLERSKGLLSGHAGRTDEVRG
jgi:hypothetical protein